MDPTTECVGTVETSTTETSIRTTIYEWYYALTAYLPRPMPRHIDEFMRLKEILINFYHLEDRPDVWFTVCGQMTSTKATSIRKPYAHYVNAAKRLETNRLVRDAKIYFNNLNEDRVKELMEDVVASPLPEPIQPTVEQPL